MLEYLALVILVAPFFAVAIRRFAPTQRRFLWFAFLGHCLGALAQLFVTLRIYGGGDMIGYLRRGELVADLVRMGNVSIADVALLALGQEAGALYWVFGVGTSTGAMTGWSALIQLLVNNSDYATVLFASLFALTGQIAIFSVFEKHAPAVFESRVAICALFVPSALFWTSGLLKESFAITGLGFALYGVNGFFEGKNRPLHGLIAVLAAGLLAIFKSYTLVPFVAASAAWWVARRSLERSGKINIRIQHILIGAVVAVVGIVSLGELFPRLEYQAAIDETAKLQGAYRQISAGSTYELGDPEARSLGEQVQYMPLALVSALFRPVLFEVHNATSAVNAFETTVLLIAVIIALRGARRQRTLYRLQHNPFLWYTIAFTLLFGVAVGLAAPNLGTLSRYRSLMFPFYAFSVLYMLPVKRH